VTVDYARWDDARPKTQELIAKGDTVGVFYVESPHAPDAAEVRHRRLRPSGGPSSIIRPAAKSTSASMFGRLRGGSWQPLHPIMDEVLGETFGIMVYQEDVSGSPWRWRVSMRSMPDPSEEDSVEKEGRQAARGLQGDDYRGAAEGEYRGSGGRGLK